INAARTSDMMLITRLIVVRLWTRVLQRDSYACRLVRTSSSRLCRLTLAAYRCTIQPVRAKTAVTAMEVESSIFQSSDPFGIKAFISQVRRTRYCRRYSADSRGHIYSYAQRVCNPLQRWESSPN